MPRTMPVLEHDRGQLHRPYIPTGGKEQKLDRGRRTRRERRKETTQIKKEIIYYRKCY